MATSILPSSDPAAIAAIPVHCVEAAGWRETARSVGDAALAFAEAQGWRRARGRSLLLPGADGALAAVLFGIGAPARRDPMLPGKLPGLLPDGDIPHRGLAGRALAALAAAPRRLPLRPLQSNARRQGDAFVVPGGRGPSPKSLPSQTRSASAATSSTRPPTISARRSWRRRPAPWPPSCAPR